MTNNAPDYENNLAFPPQGDWSDTQPKNNTDRTQSSCDMVDTIEKLTKQLEIAKRGLAFIVAQSYGKDMWDCAKGTLKKIEELEK